MKFNIRLLAWRDVKNKTVPKRNGDSFIWPPGMLVIMNDFLEMLTVVQKQLADPVERVVAIFKDAATEVQKMADEIVDKYNEEIIKIDLKIEEYFFQISEAKESEDDLELNLNLEGKTLREKNIDIKEQPEQDNKLLTAILLIAIFGTEGLLGFGVFDLYTEIVNTTQNYTRIGVYVLITIVYVIVAMLPVSLKTKKFLLTSKLFIVGQLVITLGLAVWSLVSPDILDASWFEATATVFPYIFLGGYTIFLIVFFGKKGTKHVEVQNDMEPQDTIEDIHPDIAEKNSLQRKIRGLENNIKELHQEKIKLTQETILKLKNLDVEQGSLLKKVEEHHSPYLEAISKKGTILKEVAGQIETYKSHYMSRFQKTAASNFVTPDWPNDIDIENYYES